MFRSFMIRLRSIYLFWFDLPRYLDEEMARRRATGNWD